MRQQEARFTDDPRYSGGLIPPARGRRQHRQLAARGATPLELRPGGLADQGFALPTLTSPASERRDRVGLLDRAPQEAGVLALSTLGGHACEEGDAEDTARAVSELVRDCK